VGRMADGAEIGSCSVSQKRRNPWTRPQSGAFARGKGLAPSLRTRTRQGKDRGHGKRGAVYREFALEGSRLAGRRSEHDLDSPGFTWTEVSVPAQLVAVLGKGPACRRAVGGDRRNRRGKRRSSCVRDRRIRVALVIGRRSYRRLSLDAWKRLPRLSTLGPIAVLP